MEFLLDTNVLLRLFDRGDSHYPSIRLMLRTAWAHSHQLHVAGQNIAEFWNVSTRPLSARGGYGLSIEVVTRRVAGISRITSLLHESPESYAEWLRLVQTKEVRGVEVHDARLAALMIARSIRYIVTFNSDDFSRYPEIKALSAAEAITVMSAASNPGQ